MKRSTSSLEEQLTQRSSCSSSDRESTRSRAQARSGWCRHQQTHFGTAAAADRLQARNRPTVADDGVALAAVFDPVEESSEVASGLGSADVRHEVRLSEAMLCD